MENGFFKWVWRFNAIALALAAVLVIVIGVFGAYEMWQSVTRNRYVSQTVNVDAKQDSLIETYQYGRSWLGQDGKQVITPLMISQEYRYQGSYGSGGKSSGDNTVNYLISTTGADETRWLFKGHDQLILKMQNIQRPLLAPENKRTVQARLFEVVPADSDDNKRLDHRDLRDLILTDAGFQNPVALLQGLTSVLSVLHPDDATIQLVVVKDGQTIMLLVNVEAGEILEQSLFPTVQ